MLRNHEIRSTHEQIGGSMRSHFFSYHRGTLVAPIILGLSLTLLTMVLNVSHYAIALGNPAQVTSVTASIPPRMFAVFAAGDINNPINNLYITGGGQGIIIKDGGLYSGGDTHINNTVVTGGSSAITSVGTCGPTNQCLGTGAPIFNGAPPLPLPQFFDINDFLPGGAVEAAVGSRNYHYIDGDMT